MTIEEQDRWIDTRLHSWVAVSAAAVTALAVAAAVPLIVVAERDAPVEPIGEWIVLCFSPGFVLSGWWLVRRRPRLPLGWMFLAAGVSVALAGLAAAFAAAAYAERWSGLDWGLWVFSWLWQPHGAILAIAMLVFPDGVIRSRLHRILVWFSIVVLGTSMLTSAIAAGPIVTTPDRLDGAVPGVVNPVGVDALRAVTDAIAAPMLMLNLVAVLVPLVWTAVWWKRSTGVRRRQFRWVTVLQLVWLVIPLFLFGVLPVALAGPVAIAQTLATQLLIVVAILQWRAYEVDVVVRRSVLAMALLGAGLGVYAVVVIAISVAVGQAGPVVSAVGAAVAIVTFGPLSTWIRRGVNRMFYGRRDDPFVVIRDLGRQLAATTPDPTAGLVAVVTALADQLRLPSAAVVDRHGELLAHSGVVAPDDVVAEFELDHQGGPVGVLRVGYRRGSTSITTAEVELLETLSRHIGGVVAAGELLEGLRNAQQQLTVARDEERSRIQRDLHDGLGPRLTAVTLSLDAAHNHLRARNLDAATDLVVNARRSVHDAIGDIRRLVYSLGDVDVASLGFRAALVERLGALTSNSGVSVSIDVDDLPPVPTVVEEALYRILSESVTNIVRHARATRCTVTVRFEGHRVDAVISDDGIGMPDHARPGVGIGSMRERAESLGGTLDIRCSAGQGTIVQVCLPIGVVREPVA